MFGEHFAIFIGTEVALMALYVNFAAYPFGHGKLLFEGETAHYGVANEFYNGRFYAFIVAYCRVCGYPSHRVWGVGMPLSIRASSGVRTFSIMGWSPFGGI